MARAPKSDPKDTPDTIAVEELDEIRDRIVEAIETGATIDARRDLMDMHPADIADLLESIPRDVRHQAWAEVPLRSMGEVLAEAHEGVRDDLVAHMDPELLVHAVGTLEVDDIADLVTDLPPELADEVEAAVEEEAREDLQTVLQYPEDTAGGLMNVDTVTIRENLALEVIQRYLRQRGEVPEYTDKLFIVDRKDQLTGTLFLSSLLTSNPRDSVASHADTDPVTFNAMTDADDVAHAFERYNLVSAPVIDDDGLLLGRITIDDVVDVIRDEADHSVMAPVGLDEEEDIFAPVISTTKSRALWLGVNLLTAVLASWVIGRFEASIEQLVALAVLMPIVASMGGNAGTQTLTVVIRGIGLGTVTMANGMRVLIKEALVGGLNGIIFAVIVAAVAILWYDNWQLGLIIGFAMIINLVVSAIAGVALPLAFEKAGIDPALASGVALTTVTDVIGFLAVLGLATWVLL